MKLAKFTAGSNLPARWGRKGFTLVEIMIVVLIIGILLAIAVPNFLKARDTSRTKSCVANLTQIQAAKQQWAMDKNQLGTVTPNMTDLVGSTNYIRSTPTCPAGSGTYTVNSVDTVPVCPNVLTYTDHIIK
jgi:prepilin-type N-terminal cleavage/methylation domain-containing protein